MPYFEIPAELRCDASFLAISRYQSNVSKANAARGRIAREVGVDQNLPSSAGIYLVEEQLMAEQYWLDLIESEGNAILPFPVAVVVKTLDALRVNAPIS